MVSIGVFPADARGEALAISENGQIVVGYSEDTNNVGQAFRQGLNGILEGLGILPGYVKSTARGVSRDGSVIVGNCRNTSLKSQAFRWTESDGMQGLGVGVVAGFDESSVEGVSGNGAIIVGDVSSSIGGFKRRAFLWDAVQGMRDLQAVLTNQFGFNLAGWILESATAISADGTAIVGFGTNPQGKQEAWMVKLTTTQPTLIIERFSTSVVVRWPVGFSNFVLQCKGAFAPSDIWSPVTNAPVITTGEFAVTNSVAGGARYFRLKSQ